MKARVRVHRPMTQKQIENAIEELNQNTKNIINRMYYKKPSKEKYIKEKAINNN